MTGPEIKEWLGVGGPEYADIQLPDKILEGMKDCPVPETDAQHVAVFSAFLRCAGKPPIIARSHP